jgi:YVTN family beta-propeller protein
VDFRILGPLEVADDGRAIPLDAAKHRALLGILLLHPNEVVSNERLIDELWGERPPATAPKIVQTYVSHLRRALGPDSIVTRPPGYALRIDEEELDALRFRRLVADARDLVARGDHERAGALYARSLALWRGPALADVALESFGRSEVERLDEERLDALMDRIDCDLALGRHDHLVAELEELVEQHPLRERLRAQLMLALYRSGRQTEALAVYREAHRTLVDEFGLEPARELQELEAAILSHDAAVRPPRRALAPVRVRHGRALAAAGTVLALALAVALAASLGGGAQAPEPLRLASNSVGFIDAASGLVTKSFSVGDAPRALALGFDSVWVANYAEKTVTRVDRRSGRRDTIPVDSHPTGIAAYEGMVWVSTFEGLLIPIDPRFNSVGTAIPLPAVPARMTAGREGVGEIAVGGGFLWVSVPPTTVVRIDPSRPEEVLSIAPDSGTQGAIAYRDDEAWTGGSGDVFPIAAASGTPEPGVPVGTPVRDLTFADSSLWVVSGGPARSRTLVALRRIDFRTRLIETTIRVGSDPVAVASMGGSIWVASRSDGAVSRIDPATNRVVDTITLGARAWAVVADENGVWVAVE